MPGETNQSPGQYMRGSCYVLALYLYDRTDLALYGLFNEDGRMHHAFGCDPPTGRGYDGRGMTHQSSVVVFRGTTCKGEYIRPTTRQLVAEYAAEARCDPFRPCDPSDAEIRRFIMGGRFPTLQRKKLRSQPQPSVAA